MGLVFHCTRRQRQCNGKAYINAAFVGRKLESDYWKIASSAETGDVSERVAVRNTKSRVREGADEDYYGGVDESTTRLRWRTLGGSLRLQNTWRAFNCSTSKRTQCCRRLNYYPFVESTRIIKLHQTTHGCQLRGISREAILEKKDGRGIDIRPTNTRKAPPLQELGIISTSKIQRTQIVTLFMSILPPHQRQLSFSKAYQARLALPPLSRLPTRSTRHLTIRPSPNRPHCSQSLPLSFSLPRRPHWLLHLH